MDNHFQLAILGGGCAGLSLAMRLADANNAAPSTIILEKNAHYSNDRTWCFWDVENPELKNWVDHSWINFEIKNGIKNFTKSCVNNPYLMLSAQTFYERATLKIASNNQRLTLLKNQEIIDVYKLNNNTWRIATQNNTFTADNIVDTRPNFQVNDEDSLMWQSFIGHEIESSSDLFDPKTFVLMDFDDSFIGGLGFIYMLPYTARHALIEYTVFSDKNISVEDLKEHIKPALIKYLKNADFKTLRTECGKLPMGNQKIKFSNDPTYIHAGLYAGAARPSSGYAFQRIQSWANQCANELINKQSLIAPKKDSAILGVMDEIFLIVLKTNPSLSITLFFNFFAKCKTITIIRFLSDQVSIKDCISIISSMPKLPFLKVLPAYAFKRFFKAFK